MVIIIQTKLVKLKKINTKFFSVIKKLTHYPLVMPSGERYWSSLLEVMAWCLTAPSHYLKQCWLQIISNHTNAILQNIHQICCQKMIVQTEIFRDIYASIYEQWVIKSTWLAMQYYHDINDLGLDFHISTANTMEIPQLTAKPSI